MQHCPLWWWSEYILNPDGFTLIVKDSLFENNTNIVLDAINLNVKNSNFINNRHVFLESGTPGSGTDYAGIAINATNLNVDNCTFDGNGIISKHEYAGHGGYGGAINAVNLVVNNSKFINNLQTPLLHGHILVDLEEQYLSRVMVKYTTASLRIILLQILQLQAFRQ
ncbi:MAG: hypothetical protein BZ136_01780 [Methanosphaera sp. rholeuAM74]|nr:MAG: hypothetical protein BZ136_01780 [Methanosphaera sp. rholeuAM74]